VCSEVVLASDCQVKDVLGRWPGELDRWYAFSAERQRGRARAWLADAGYYVRKGRVRRGPRPGRIGGRAASPLGALGMELLPSSPNFPVCTPYTSSTVIAR
jgi:hypothetical protein